jgi:hypothetical protein
VISVAQTILTVVADVEPASAELLRGRIAHLEEREEFKPQESSQSYDHLRSAAPSLHFMSLTVFTDDQYDPIFVLEANFDGPPGPFWAQLEAAIGPELRDLFRCCKAPRDETARLFLAVTRSGSRVPVAPLLEALTVKPIIHHQGNRGLDRARLLQEGKLFAAIQSELGIGSGFRKQSARCVHQYLRQRLLAKFAWLDMPAAPRITFAENVGDWVRLGLFLSSCALPLALPGFWVAFRRDPVWPDFLLRGTTVLLALASISILGAVTGVIVLAWLRWLERRDPSHDDPKLDARALSAMARHEDHIAQNHMISLVHVKPGVLRAVLLRLGLRVLGLILRISARDGYLSSMRTIHFAHWALVSNGGRLMFHSNFDGSWESYLDDFIEKAHAGLTLAWTSGIGFPPTEFMYRKGATSGRRFKAWARHSMVESLFWFSAYREYSVNQIERHARIANGLRKPELKEQEAIAWAIDL